MSEENKRVVLKYLTAMCAGDRNNAVSCLTTDAISIAKGFSKLSGIRPTAMFVEMIGAITQLVPEGLQPEIHKVIAEGDDVMIEFDGNAITADGTPYRNQYCMVFTLEGGKIRQVNEYFCTKLAEDVLLPLLAKLESKSPWN